MSAEREVDDSVADHFRGDGSPIQAVAGAADRHPLQNGEVPGADQRLCLESFRLPFQELSGLFLHVAAGGDRQSRARTVQCDDAEMFQLGGIRIVRRFILTAGHGKAELPESFSACAVFYVGVMVSRSVDERDGAFQERLEKRQNPREFTGLSAACGVTGKKDCIRLFRQHHFDCGRDQRSVIARFADDIAVEKTDEPFVETGVPVFQRGDFMGVGEMDQFAQHVVTAPHPAGLRGRYLPEPPPRCRPAGRTEADFRRCRRRDRRQGNSSPRPCAV